MTERQIQLGILRDLGASIVCACPNYTPAKWWECDLWTVTRSGYAVEYEIKLSARDFRADRAKIQRRWNGVEVTHHTKHERVGEAIGPSRFFYVVPRDLVPAIEAKLPEWAGLGVCTERGGDPRAWYTEVRTAKVLHRVKVPRREIVLAQRRMWFRYWKAIEDIERMKHDRQVITSRSEP